MKSSLTRIKIIFLFVLVLAFLLPMNVFAETPFYIAFKPGAYFPQSSDLDGFDTGFSGEAVFGYRFSPNFAGEAGIGFFNTEGEKTVGSTGRVDQDFDVYVYPITVTLKAILPYKKWEFFGLGGVGVYIVSRPYNDDHDHHHDHDHDYDDDDDDDYDAVWGGYLGAGFNYNITPKFFIGLEGKYLWTETAKLDDRQVQFNLDGIIATGVIGFRF